MTDELDKTLDLIRTADFSVRTEKKLKEHPYVKAIENGKLELHKLKNLIHEQFYVQQDDLKSIETVANKSKSEGKTACYEFFKLLTDGEKYAGGLLQNMAKWLKLSSEDLIAYESRMKARAYPSFLARCAMYEPASFVACACAINFPAWGKMCGRVHNAIKLNKSIYGEVKDEDIDFLNFFATPIEGFDEMALKCLKEENSESLDFGRLRNVVRLLQEAEVLFWDSIYES